MSQAVFAGLLAGLGLSTMFSVILNGRMEGMGTLDPFILVIVLLTVAAVAVSACLVPGRVCNASTTDGRPPTRVSHLRLMLAARFLGTQFLFKTEP